MPAVHSKVDKFQQWIQPAKHISIAIYLIEQGSSATPKSFGTQDILDAIARSIYFSMMKLELILHLSWIGWKLISEVLKSVMGIIKSVLTHKFYLGDIFPYNYCKRQTLHYSVTTSLWFRKLVGFVSVHHWEWSYSPVLLFISLDHKTRITCGSSRTLASCCV